jgi:hypothetical protein
MIRETLTIGDRMFFIVKGAEGAVTFGGDLSPSGDVLLDVDWYMHSRAEREWMTDHHDCPFIDGETCWCDGRHEAMSMLLSYLNSEKSWLDLESTYSDYFAR